MAPLGKSAIANQAILVDIVLLGSTYFTILRQSPNAKVSMISINSLKIAL